jgi:hypothetical protein
MLYAAYGASAYSFLICFFGSLLSDVRLGGHRNNTYIEISGASIIVSQYNQTGFMRGKPVYYKKLWIADLKDIEEVIYARKRITIVGKARYFNSEADSLRYERTDDGVKFEHWWYDSNGGSEVRRFEAADYYLYGERIAKRIAVCSRKIKEREIKRETFRREMLEIAKEAEKKRARKRAAQKKTVRVFRP